jgi:hypothetical protein
VIISRIPESGKLKGLFQVLGKSENNLYKFTRGKQYLPRQLIGRYCATYFLTGTYYPNTVIFQAVFLCLLILSLLPSCFQCLLIQLILAVTGLV